MQAEQNILTVYNLEEVTTTKLTTDLHFLSVLTSQTNYVIFYQVWMRMNEFDTQPDISVT